MNPVLLLTGTCGSGKTTIALNLAKAGWFRISEDDLWQERFGKQRGPFGSEEHRLKRQRVHEAVFAAINAALRKGQRIVIDATIHESPPEAFHEYRSWFESQSVEWRLWVLHPRVEVAVARDASRLGWHAGAERVAHLHAKFTGLAFSPESFLDSSDDSPEETTRRILTG